MNLKILSLVIIGVCILLPDVCYAFLSKDVHLLNMQTDWPTIPYLLFIRIKKASFGLEPETVEPL